MQNDRPSTDASEPYPDQGRQRLLIVLAVIAAIVLAGGLHLVGLLPPG